jgi:signal transduction histidine kinase
MQGIWEHLAIPSFLTSKRRKHLTSVIYRMSFTRRCCKKSGLPAALSAYCEEFSKVRGLPVSCETDESLQELSPGAALCLYRIAQEALGNAAKYSQAMKVEVRLTRADSRVRLSVADDGVGCDPHQTGKSGGLGVINMRERVLQLQGTFEFDSAPGRGATVKAEIPFRPAP